MGNESIPHAAFKYGPSSFGERLIRWNRLDEEGFAAWEFLPGMRFGERTAWWRGASDRGGAHEGLDLCCFRARDGRQLRLGPGARVPALWPGRVAAVVEDFLGRSVFLSHDRVDGTGSRLHSVYGHIVPAAGVAAGTVVGDGGEVGTVAEAPSQRRGVPPHLHLTLALIRAGAGPLDWRTLRDPSRAVLLDPQPAIG